MNLIKITELSTEIGLSSRTLRYYEEAGLITSVRPQFEKYRFYDEQNVQRLRQIMVLRKMQIPIKDIVRIYESHEMSAITQVFVDKINEIDGEVTALSELKRIINEFLQKMIEKGIKQISALPLLYEEMDKQLTSRENINMEQKNFALSEALNEVSEKLAKPLDISIIRLPKMRVLSSYLKDDAETSDTTAFMRYLQMNGMKADNYGSFEYQENDCDVMITKIADGFTNDSNFTDFIFDGGYFAAANVYLDDDLAQSFYSLVKSFDDNKFYQIDYTADGNLRHAAMLENLISPDERRQLVALYVPVKKRIPDVSLYPKPTEITNITVGVLKKQNPILWEKEVELDKLTPINNPHYRVMENGEVEYTGWISTRTLSTNVSVKLPFRVDIEFRVPMDDEQFGYGDNEGSIIFYHGDDNGYNIGVNLGIMGFGINMNNHSNRPEESISFHQPVFHDYYNFPHKGRIKPNEYNHVTWIIGQKYLAVIINGEIRYCGANFPYMYLDLNSEKAYPVVIGSNGQGKKYFRAIKISQLAYSPKTKIKNGELTMITKQSNSIISIIHRLITDEYGENYWFNGSAKYVMECLGEKEYDYWFFAGITGDVFTQHYKQPFMGDSIDAHYQVNGDFGFFERIFEKCGYASTFVTLKDISKNKEMYLNALIGYIDKGIPVIALVNGINKEYSSGFLDGVFVGYEEHGKTLLYITGNNNEPQRIPFDKAIDSDKQELNGWVFVGEKKKQKDLATLYREAIYALPELLTTNNDKYCFGSAAFRVWADDVENGHFDGMKPEEFDGWSMYTNFVCVLATNGSCCHGFLQRAKELNPDMTYLDEISKLYKRTGEIWNNDNGNDLEALGGGFNVTLEALQTPEKRSKIAARIRECGDIMDKVVNILKENIRDE
ncbi:MAG: MerR family transcriptional regulator [Oscillospiraceae bacterium]|nr:MerR family transcriptional regulator [Oscillospiraceae bacterium]